MTEEEARPIGFLVDAWKTTVEVQQHFNQLCMTIRNLAITVLGAGIGSIPFLVKEGFTLTLFNHNKVLITFVFLLLSVIWLAFYFFDRWWYHRFLSGAGIHAGELETKIKASLPVWGLSQEIKKASDFKLLWFIPLRSKYRLDLFYLSIFLALISMAIFSYGKDNLFFVEKKSTSEKDLVAKIDSLMTKRDSLLINNIKLSYQTNTSKVLSKQKKRKGR